MNRQSDPRRCSLYFDGYGKSPAILGCEQQLERIVRTVADQAGMRVIRLVTSNIESDLRKLNQDVFEDEGGISIQALISTSHITLHTWPARSAFMFDLVSCKPFDQIGVHRYLVGALAVESTAHYQVYDGHFDLPGVAQQNVGNVADHI
jgi:S-adenosylmethionine/arginine decarboxylase-like enzyme